MNIPCNEQETTIAWHRTDDYMLIYTSDSTVMTKLNNMCAKCSEYSLYSEDKYSKTYKCPPNLLSFRQPVRTQTISDEERKRRSERAKKNFHK